jgi:hypothetical protein
MLSSTDATWTIANAMYWSVIETNIGIWAASIPSFKALAKRFMPFLLGEYSSNNMKYPSAKQSGSNGAFHKMQNLSGRQFGSVKIKEITDDTATSASHESEERLAVPAGRIMARTDITSEVEQGQPGYLTR